MDVQAYQNTAKQIVAKAEQMRKDGKTVTYGDFSDEVNARLKVYNATMRINRLENIKSQIGAEMLSANLDVQSAISDKLTDDYQAEIKRQAGIMGENTEGKLWTSKQVAKVVMAQTAGADFSKRIWANQDALKAELDGIISTGIIRGESPRKMATRIKSQVKDSVMNHKYVTERIARTESARVQYTAQIDEIKKNGYQYVQWFAEPKACAECSSIAHADNGYGEGIYKINKVPKIPDDTHPNCRCAISETWVDGEQNLGTIQEAPAPELYRKHTIPVSYKPYSVAAKIARTGVIQYRIYDANGNPKVDYDLTNHGSPKYHPVVPHAHEWLVVKDTDGVKYKRSKRWRKLNNVERKNIEGWAGRYDNK